ncbi:MAG: hypothetical protein ACI8Z7_000181 [Candidatus Nanohaloarchaea archaeon]|jgi:hypothetical protein
MINRGRLLKTSIEYNKPLLAGLAGGAIVKLSEEPLLDFFLGAILLISIGFFSHYEIMRVEEKYLEK